MRNQTILWIDQIAFARIEDSPQSLKFIVRDDEGCHLSVWQKENIFRFEFSSNESLGSTWDDTRRGIARSLGYEKWQKHANYVVNRTMDFFADSDIPDFGARWAMTRRMMVSVLHPPISTPISSMWLSWTTSSPPLKTRRLGPSANYSSSCAIDPQKHQMTDSDILTPEEME
ncbi:MAG: hypothetical protein WCP45_11085 [Verrucomicrobiota bacterium]